jgi:hydroxymethylpyrimidine/phosphomethylpyrimidine kinase
VKWIQLRVKGKPVEQWKLIARQVQDICRNITVITPNLVEAKALDQSASVSETAGSLNECCAVFVTAFAEDKEQVTDCLFYQDKTRLYSGRALPGGSQHGSGCILSSALAAYLALGRDIENACSLAREYTQSYLSSSASFPGQHYRTAN